MKKILFLIDAFNFQVTQLDFPVYIANYSKSKLIGVFLKNETLEAVPEVKKFGGQLYIEEITPDAKERRQFHQTMRNNIELFKDNCIRREINATVHVEEGNPLENVIKESRYADLLIVDPRISLTNDTSVLPKFIVRILTEAECPVLVAPEIFEPVDEIVLTYDDSKSSVFAIKQFYYHLPEFSSKKITVLHIADTNEAEQEDLKVKREFIEWLELHFLQISFTQRQGDAKEALFTYFMEHNERNNKLLVTGAFGRSMLSSFFKHSTAETVLKTIDIPVFIAHG